MSRGDTCFARRYYCRIWFVYTGCASSIYRWIGLLTSIMNVLVYIAYCFVVAEEEPQGPLWFAFYNAPEVDERSVVQGAAG